VTARGEPSSSQALQLAASRSDGATTGRLLFRDRAVRLDFEASRVDGVAADGATAWVHGRGTTKTRVPLRFSAVLDERAGTFALRLENGYAASGVLDGGIAVTGSCGYDGASSPVLDAPRRVSATIGRSGGALGAGGLMLTVPPGALSEDVTISLTPLLDLAGSPLEGTLAGGAKLEPEGLRFLRPARLTLVRPAGVAAADLVGFGSAGDGSELHLEPLDVTASALSLDVWHFSTAGASSGGGAAVAAVASRTPTAEEARARARIAAAQPACRAELDAGVADGPACAHLREETVRALFAWYDSGVRPALAAAESAPSFTAEASLAEWLAWEAEVQTVFLDDTPLCGTLQNECDAARELATTAVAGHASRRLANCTGTSLAGQVRDVSRMADFAAAGALDLATRGLPDATNGDLIRACAHLEIAVTDFPGVAARFHSNTLRGRVTVDVFSGADRTDLPFTLTVDGALVAAAGDGTFATTLTPTHPSLPLNVVLEAEATDPSFQTTAFGARENLSRPTRPRLELIPQGPTTVPAGGTVPLLVRVAGDGMAGASVALAVTGAGTVAPSAVTTNAAGSATAAYAAPASAPASDTVTATFAGASETVAITVAPAVTVAIAPTSVTLAPGTTRQFAATVTGAADTTVTWSASGGSVSPSGLFTAGSATGTFSVTATSVADPARSATATVRVEPAAAAAYTLGSRTFRVGTSALAGAQGDDENCTSDHDSENHSYEAPADEADPGLDLLSFGGSSSSGASASAPGGGFGTGSASSALDLLIAEHGRGFSLAATASAGAVTTANMARYECGASSGFRGSGSGLGSYSAQLDFTLTARFAYTIAGSGSAGTNGRSFADVRIVQRPTLRRLAGHRVPTDGTTIDRAGVLEAGSYRINVNGDCSAEFNDVCTSSLGVVLVLEPLP
jgi:hypothetical protein